MRRSNDPKECVTTVTREAPWGTDLGVEEVISVLEPLVSDARRLRLHQVFEQRLECVNVLLDAPHDPLNGAAVVRSCDAFGIQELHVLPRVEPFLMARRVARGTQAWVEVIEHGTVRSAVQQLTSRGFELVATHPRGQLEPPELRELGRVTLVLGNEHRGIVPDLLAACSRTVRVPMRGFVESLNLSACAAVLLAAATQGRAGDLPPARQRLLYARGLFRTVPRAGIVLRAQKRATGPRSTGSHDRRQSEPVT
jgi:tRNA (guanosine-2'-O-)-methyltransferase